MSRRVLLALLVLAAAAGPAAAIAGDLRDGLLPGPDLLLLSLAVATGALQLRGGGGPRIPRRVSLHPFHSPRRRRRAVHAAEVALVLLVAAAASAGKGAALLLLVPAGVRALRGPSPAREMRTLRDGTVLAFGGLVVLGSPASLLGAVAATLLAAAFLANRAAPGAARPARTVLGVVPATAVAAALLFLLLPRFGDRVSEEPSAAAERRERAAREGALPSGEFVPATALRRVAIGDIGRIQRDFRALLEVEVVRGGAPADAEDLGPLFRGGALEEFDGTTWRSEDASVLRRDAMDGAADGFVAVPGRRLPGGEAVEQRLRFLVGGTDSLFCLGMPTAVGGESAAGRARLLPRGEVRAADSYGDGAVFTVRSVALPGDHALVDPEALSDARRRRLLAVPPGHARAAAWARTQLAGAGSGARLLRRVDGVLRRQCSYDLDLRPVPGASAVEGFLFGARRGHCELFASAAAVMLRAVGVPSRVVIGFRGGQWDEAARRYSLRGADAHAWVEAWCEGEGWRTLDPTPAPDAPPPGEEETAGDAEGGAGAAARLLRYDAGAQRRFLLAAVRLGGEVLRDAFLDAEGRLRVGTAVLVSLAAALLAGALVARGRTGRAPAPAPEAAEPATPPPPPEAWTLLLRTLAASGLRRGPAETAAELAARAVAAGAAPADAVRAVADAYAEERWGGRAPDAARRAALRDLAGRVSLPGPA